MNMDVQNKFGETALHVCSGQSGNLELAKLLILKGANYTLKNQLGDSPLGITFLFVWAFYRLGEEIWQPRNLNDV